MVIYDDSNVKSIIEDIVGDIRSIVIDGNSTIDIENLRSKFEDLGIEVFTAHILGSLNPTAKVPYQITTYSTKREDRRDFLKDLSKP